MIRQAIALDNASERRCKSARRLVATLALAGMVAALPAEAAKPAACYTKGEYEAEQAVRFHTEMMLVGLTCKDVMPEKNLFVKYREFTNRHRGNLMQWEKVLIEHFRRNYGGNATRQFDTFRTEMANQMSRRAASITSSQYCGLLGNGAVDAMDMSGDDFKMLAGEDVIMRMAGKPPCERLSDVVPGKDGPIMAAAGTVPPPSMQTATGPETSAKKAPSKKGAGVVKTSSKK
ncbi:MAG TPA: hypothetical protein VEB64_10460 [Azospirillaceae bacterium]|nr:hypothetical protein [Azospirillaceae bacterium]